MKTVSCNDVEVLSPENQEFRENSQGTDLMSPSQEMGSGWPPEVAGSGPRSPPPETVLVYCVPASWTMCA